MLSILIEVVCAHAVTWAPLFPVPGWAFVEAACEACSEVKGATSKASFFIWNSSDPKFLGKRFEVEYLDVARRSDRHGGGIDTLWLPAFALDDRAFFWVRYSGSTVMPVIDRDIFRVTPDREFFMRPIRDQHARAKDEVLVKTSEAYRKQFAEPVMKIVLEKDKANRVALLQQAAEGRNEMLAKWAKWVQEKHYPLQVAATPPAKKN